MKPHSTPVIWVIALGGVLLLILAVRMKTQPSWLRFTQWLAAIFCELYVGSGVFVRRLDVADRWFDFANQGHSFLGGISIGLLMATGVFRIFSRSSNASDLTKR
jgi:hypothetical protein